MDELSTYLGDGVYASYDGFQIWLAVNDRDNNVVALEPMTFGALVRYVENLRGSVFERAASGEDR